jgi:hypothetical protein
MTARDGLSGYLNLTSSSIWSCYPGKRKEVSRRQPRDLHDNVHRSLPPAPSYTWPRGSRGQASPRSPPATPSRIGRASREGSAAAGVAMEPASCTVPHLAVRVARDPSAHAVLPLGTCVSSAPLPPGSCSVRLRRRQSQDLRLETKGNKMDTNGE